jgi:SAM-dependent methyltransferase
LDSNKINILIPGRHHMLTKFQQQYLRDIIQSGVNGKQIEKIIFAVTSSNHENTRRNPVPLYLRAMAIDEFSRDLHKEVKIYPIPDIKQSEKFATYILRQIYYQSGQEINPQNTIVACSTPPVIKLFENLGFENLPVELESTEPEKYHALRPYEVVDLLVKAGKNWRIDKGWREHASLATQNIYEEYNLGDLICELFSDALLSDDADITETRDYGSYAISMDNAIKFKFDDIKPFIKEGKIVDVGCSTGSLIRLLAQEFQESDIIGIEAVRKFYEFCRSQEYPSPYVFFYRRNVTDQNFKDSTINSFIYSSVLHEVYSYIGEPVLDQVLQNSYNQLDFGGRIIIRDVVGPEDPDKLVLMELNNSDGSTRGDIDKLSTYKKFFRFAEDFLPRKIKYEEHAVGHRKFIKLRLQDAYEYMSKKNYTDNWKSEMHEEFGFYSFKAWKNKLESYGFHVVPGSKAFVNPYIVNNSYKNSVSLYRLENNKLVEEDYPPTNMILVGEK